MSETARKICALESGSGRCHTAQGMQLAEATNMSGTSERCVTSCTTSVSKKWACVFSRIVTAKPVEALMFD